MPLLGKSGKNLGTETPEQTDTEFLVMCDQYIIVVRP
jgi:hypothetical protein